VRSPCCCFTFSEEDFCSFPTLNDVSAALSVLLILRNSDVTVRHKSITIIPYIMKSSVMTGQTQARNADRELKIRSCAIVGQWRPSPPSGVSRRGQGHQRIEGKLLSLWRDMAQRWSCNNSTLTGFHETCCGGRFIPHCTVTVSRYSSVEGTATACS
jgi:hypothetical protein